jgi:hypothetical protein
MFIWLSKNPWRAHWYLSAAERHGLNGLAVKESNCESIYLFVNLSIDVIINFFID